MDYSKITNSIFVGGKPEDIRDLTDLRDEGVNYIINMMDEDNSEEDMIREGGLDFLHVPVEDGFPMALSELVHTSEKVVDAIVNDMAKVYIHCAYGVGRSPYMAAAVFMNLGMSTYDAINFVSSKRMISKLSPWQEIALINFERHRAGEEPIEQSPDEEAVTKFWNSRATWLKSVGMDIESDSILRKITSGVILVR